MTSRLSFSLLAVVALANVASAGERFALCIGLNAKDRPGDEKIAYAENDAREFAEQLRGVGYRVVLMTPGMGTLDAKLSPTRSNIDAQLAAIVDNRKPDDLVMVAIAGREMSLADIAGRLGRCEARAKVLFADVQHASQSPLPIQAGIGVLLACSTSQRSFEFTELRHGVFFHHLIEGLVKAGKPETDLRLEELMAYVTAEAPTTVWRLGGADKMQTPKSDMQTLPGTVLLTATDRQLLAEGRTAYEWESTRGWSLGYYRAEGQKRMAAWKAAADRGAPWGMIMYGRCLVEGIGIVRDAAGAVEWYRKAAGLGDSWGYAAWQLVIGLELVLSRMKPWRLSGAGRRRRLAIPSPSSTSLFVMRTVLGSTRMN